MAQPDVSLETVSALLAGEVPGPIRDLEPLLGGSVGRAFGFTSAGEAFVIRFNWRTLGGFGKEETIERLLAGSVSGGGVPFPHLVKTGHVQAYDWAISVRLPGSGFEIDAAALMALLPSLFATLDAIHAADLTGTTGYGGFDATGVGRDPNWHAHVRSVREDGPEGGYFPSWETLFATTVLDRATIDALMRTVEATLPFCPEDRQLVHGDFGFDNVLVKDGQVSGVIDWLNARFGDGLYDVAWLDFWPDPPLGIAGEYIAWKAAQGAPLLHAAERIRCYQAMIAVDSLRFFANANLVDAYHWLSGRILHLMTA
ncbi:MAG: phosphotransferase [Thermomicrobiales bacterium]